MNEWPIPQAAIRDPDAVEMLVFGLLQRLHCAIKIGIYRETMNSPEEFAWGTILADAARHVAHALEAEYGTGASTTLAAIRDAFLRKVDDPTSQALGDFV